MLGAGRIETKANLSASTKGLAKISFRKKNVNEKNDLLFYIFQLGQSMMAHKVSFLGEKQWAEKEERRKKRERKSVLTIAK